MEDDHSLTVPATELWFIFYLLYIVLCGHPIIDTVHW